uniref:Uncharacterized protein n=1 Tax=Salarias fasciatus TaxID=181472 RepID=A0A672FCL3_SALFA
MKNVRFSAGGGRPEENRDGTRVWNRLKIPTKIWKNQVRRDQLDHTEGPAENPDRLDQVSRRLILREDRLFGQTSSVQEEDQLHRDLRVLEDLLWTAVQNTFSSSVDQQEALRSAVTAIQQQEEQDRRWAELQGPQGPGGRVPAWRPLRLLRTHDLLLEDLVEARLKDACEDQTVGRDLSSAVKRQVCALGRRVKDDLLTAARTVAPCYPAHLDILTLFLRLYHRRFSRHLEHLAQQQLQPDDGRYLLLWANRLYTAEVLQLDELQMKVSSVGFVPLSSAEASFAEASSLEASSLEASPLSGSCPQRTTSCLGPLLGDERLKVLEDRYLSSSEDRLKLWLDNLLSREQQAWRTGRDPEVLDGYRFSPLAADAIQVSHWSRSVSGPGQSLVQVSRWSRSVSGPGQSLVQ